MKNLFCFFPISLAIVFVLLIIPQGLFAQIQNEEALRIDGELKNAEGLSITTISKDGIFRDINKHVTLKINAVDGSVLDGNDDYIGKIVNNQILDWDDNILYTLGEDNKIYDMNNHEVGFVDTETKEIKNYSGMVLGSYNGIPIIYAVYYYFIHSSY